MQRPTDPDPIIALALLDVCTRPWAHIADAAFEVGALLVSAGVPVARLELQLPITHPLLAGGRAAWSPEEGGTWAVRVGEDWLVEGPEERERGANPLRRASPPVLAGPSLFDAIAPEVLRGLQEPDGRGDEPLTLTCGEASVLAAAFSNGASFRSVLLLSLQSSAAVAQSTVRAFETAAWGFSALARSARWRALCHVLAHVYVGPRTGLRVLRGQLHRGDLERRQAVVWFSDLRGFTALSVERGAEGVVACLNEVFDHVEREVHAGCGEILKFIGDAVLAVFPYANEADAPDAVRRAVRAAADCLRALPPDLPMGIGLHRGEVAYGNIGAASRLDFTVIGPTVNLASRLEGLTATLEVPVLASAEVAAVEPARWQSAGSHALKGIPGMIEAYALV